MSALRHLWRAGTEPLRRLTVQDWVWLHFKAAMLVWAGVLWRFTPVRIDDALGGLTVAVSAVTILGGLVSITGLIVSAWSRRAAVRWLGVELSGITLMAVGPGAYFATQVWLAVTLPGGEQRYALCVLAYVLCAAVLARFVIVVRRRRRTIRGV